MNVVDFILLTLSNDLIEMYRQLVSTQLSSFRLNSLSLEFVVFISLNHITMNITFKVLYRLFHHCNKTHEVSMAEED